MLDKKFKTVKTIIWIATNLTEKIRISTKNSCIDIRYTNRSKQIITLFHRYKSVVIIYGGRTENISGINLLGKKSSKFLKAPFGRCNGK